MTTRITDLTTLRHAVAAAVKGDKKHNNVRVQISRPIPKATYKALREQRDSEGWSKEVYLQHVAEARKTAPPVYSISQVDSAGMIGIEFLLGESKEPQEAYDSFIESVNYHRANSPR